MVLVLPPGVRSTEPPIGLARVAGLLRREGRKATILDLNQEGLEWLLTRDTEADGQAPTRDRRALKNRGKALATLRNPASYRLDSFDRYKRAVADLGLALRHASAPSGARVGLSDYEEKERSPIRRADLLDAASRPEGSVFYPLFRERLVASLHDDGEGVLGISLGFLGQALPAFALAGVARRLDPNLKIVLGGGLLSSWIAQGRISADETFGGLFDALLPGRAEGSLGDWLAPGSASAPCPDRQDPAPDFSGFRGYRYFAPTRILPFNFSSGCSWRRCTFCPEAAEAAPYRGMSRGLALREIAALAKSEGPGLLHLTDNEVAPRYLRALSEAGPGIPWYGFARFTPHLGDPAFCRDLAASGCRMLQLGLESADQGVLDKLDKGIELAAVGRALDSLAAAGVGVYLYLLFGTPAEDRRSALRTRDFVAERAQAIGFINAAVFNLPATSAESAGIETRDFYEGDLALYKEFAHPAGWNRTQVRRFLAEDFAGHPSIGPILRRTPPIFTSSHAPFFLEPRQAEDEPGTTCLRGARAGG